MGIRIKRTEPTKRHRKDDWETSVEGARNVALREGTQKRLLLEVYAHGATLTDEEAAERAELLHTCYWKRCGELRELGYIEHNGTTRMGGAGVHRIVCQITPEGQGALS